MRKKTFQSEDKNVLSQPACLNRIYRSINSQGFTEETIRELRADIDYISGYTTAKDVEAFFASLVDDFFPKGKAWQALPFRIRNRRLRISH